MKQRNALVILTASLCTDVALLHSRDQPSQTAKSAWENPVLRPRVSVALSAMWRAPFISEAGKYFLEVDFLMILSRMHSPNTTTIPMSKIPALWSREAAWRIEAPS
jgi:hypothetical protein